MCCVDSWTCTVVGRCASSVSNSRRRLDLREIPTVAPPGFCDGGRVRYGSIGGLEYEVPQSRLYCLYINVALCSTALQCICRVIRRSSMTMKAHTYYIIFGRPPIGGKLPPGGATGYPTRQAAIIITGRSEQFTAAPCLRHHLSTDARLHHA